MADQHIVAKPVSTSNRLDEIDVLRGVAALAVVVFHYSGHCQRYFSNFPFFFEYGKYGVQLFFVISGFFIYSTLKKCKDSKEFLFLRFSRLYPAYWATLLLLLLLDMVTLNYQPWINGYLVNATMLQSSMGFPDIDIVYWSLAVEMGFYILMAALFAMNLIRFPIASSLIWLTLVNIFPYIRNTEVFNISYLKMLIGLLEYGPFFIGGMMFHLIRNENGHAKKDPIAIILMCVATVCLTSGIQMGTVALISFALMWGGLQGMLSILVNRITVWLGAISYSLYLVHRNLGYFALFALDGLGLDSKVSFLIVIAGALSLASVFTYLIEKPSLKYLRRRYVKYG